MLFKFQSSEDDVVWQVKSTDSSIPTSGAGTAAPIPRTLGPKLEVYQWFFN